MTATNAAFIERVDADLPMRVLDLYGQGQRANAEDLADLNQMSGDELRALIAESLIDGDDEDWVALMTLPIRSRTFVALHQIRLHLQREAAKARELRGEARELRTNRIRIRRDQIYRWIGLAKDFVSADHEAHMAAVQAGKADRLRQAGELRGSRVGEAVLLLAAAIRRHQLETRAAGLSPEPHDAGLWAVLDRITIPTNRDGEIPVGVAVTRKDWLARLAEHLSEGEAA